MWGHQCGKEKPNGLIAGQKRGRMRGGIRSNFLACFVPHDKRPLPLPVQFLRATQSFQRWLLWTSPLSMTYSLQLPTKNIQHTCNYHYRNSKCCPVVCQTFASIDILVPDTSRCSQELGFFSKSSAVQTQPPTVLATKFE